MSIEKHQQEISLIEVADDGCVDFSREVDDSLNSKTKDRKLGVDILVRDYLISRGYKQAAETLDKERNPQLNQLDNRSTTDKIEKSSYREGAASLMIHTFVEDLCVLGNQQSNSNPVEQYISGYEIYRNWAFSSLDVVSGSLIAVSFPIFAHCYIGLVRYGTGDEAQMFWKKWSLDHTTSYSHHLRLLTMLFTSDQLTSDEFIANNPLIKKLLTSKFSVCISSFGYKLLTDFLMQSDLLLITSIINSRVNFTKIAEDISNTNSIIAELHGFDISANSTGNLPLISLIVPGKGAKPSNVVPLPVNPSALPGPSDSGSTTTSSATDSTVPFSVISDPLVEEWLDKIIRPNEVLFKRARHTQSESRTTTDVSTSSAIQSTSVPVASKLKANAAEPSILFATVTNSYGGLISMDINRNVTQAVTGSRDSCVRIWRLGDDSSASTSDWWSGSANKEAVSSGFEYSEIFPASKTGPPGTSSSNGSSNTFTKKLRSTPSQNIVYDNATAALELRGHRMSVFGVHQCATTDRLVLSSSADESIRLWDLKIRQCVGKYCCLSIPWSVKFSPIGYYFASTNADRTGTVYATDKMTPIRLLVGHSSDANCLDWHGNAVLLATGSEDRTARLWDIRTAAAVRVLAGSTTAIQCVSISPHGKLMAGGTENGKVYVWDIASARQLCILEGHSGPVHSVSFSDDEGSNSKVLISGGADSSVRVWKVDSVVEDFASDKLSKETQCVLTPRHTFFTKNSPVYCVGFTSQNLGFAGGSFSMPSSQGTS